MEETAEDIFNKMKENFLRFIQTHKSYALISAYRDGIAEDEIQKKRSGLKWSIRHLKLVSMQFFAKWTKTDNETNRVANIKEFGSIAYDISLKDAMELGKKYNQLSIVFKSGDECSEMCVIPFTNSNGDKHDEGDVIRTFNVKSPDIVREIFGERVGCPCSKSNDGRHPYALDGVFRIEDPKPSVFSPDEKLHPIL